MKVFKDLSDGKNAILREKEEFLLESTTGGFIHCANQAPHPGSKFLTRCNGKGYKVLDANIVDVNNKVIIASDGFPYDIHACKMILGTMSKKEAAQLSMN